MIDGPGRQNQEEAGGSVHQKASQGGQKGGRAHEEAESLVIQEC